jgi:hypothetical protein
MSKNRNNILYRFQVHIVVEMQVVQVLKCMVNTLLMKHVVNTNLLVDKQVQHIVSLPANLQPSVDPIQPHPEEFGTLQQLEKVLFGLGFFAL